MASTRDLADVIIQADTPPADVYVKLALIPEVRRVLDLWRRGHVRPSMIEHVFQVFADFGMPEVGFELWCNVSQGRAVRLIPC